MTRNIKGKHDAQEASCGPPMSVNWSCPNNSIVTLTVLSVALRHGI